LIKVDQARQAEPHSLKELKLSLPLGRLSTQRERDLA
jgi:hypothetical protein